MTHALKTWPEYYKQVESGEKTFELRKMDRDFKVGDVLLLQEYDPETKAYTGKESEFTIQYVLRGPGFGLHRNFCIMAIKPKEHFV